jgi:hypothetical protein
VLKDQSPGLLWPLLVGNTKYPELSHYLSALLYEELAPRLKNMQLQWIQPQVVAAAVVPDLTTHF